MSEENQVLLRAVPGFQGISEESLQAIAASAVLRRFRAGTELMDDPVRSAGLYVIASGTVAMMLGQGRRSYRVARLTPGELLSSLDLPVDGEQLVLRVVAELDVVALELPRWRFQELLDSADPQLGGPLRRALIISLVRRVRIREQRIARYEVDAGTALPPGTRRRVMREDTEPPSRPPGRLGSEP